MSSRRGKKTITIQGDLRPDGTPHEVTIQKLAGRHLRKADEERDFALNEYVEKMGGASYRERMAAQHAKATADRKASGEPPVIGDPVHAFDQATLVKFAVIAWTFTDLDDGAPIPVSDVEVDELDAERLEHIARESLRWTKPALFLDFDQRETDKKKAEADSPVA